MKIYTLNFVTSEPCLPDFVSFEAADRVATLVLGREEAAIAWPSYGTQSISCAPSAGRRPPVTSRP